MMNMFWEPLEFDVPAYAAWQTAINTSLESPRDIADPRTGPRCGASTCRVESRTIVVLEQSLTGGLS